MNVEPAREQDIKPICDLVQEQAALGHFHEGLAMKIDAVRRGLEGQAECAIKLRKVSTNNEFTEFKESRLYAAHIEGEFVGFCWLAAYRDDDVVANEIYMLAVRKQHRRKGVGRELVKYAISLVSSDSDVYARIYHKSTFMMSLALSEGFREQQTDAKRSRLFVRKKS